MSTGDILVGFGNTGVGFLGIGRLGGFCLGLLKRMTPVFKEYKGTGFVKCVILFLSSGRFVFVHVMILKTGNEKLVSIGERCGYKYHI